MKTVLVTGSNRSGTTWFSKMLSLSGKFLEVYEPFNHLIHTPTIFSQAPFSDHYHHVLTEEYPKVKRYVNGRIIYSIFTDQSTYWEGIKEQQKLDKVIKLYGGISNFISFIIKKKTILIKDPIALLSADWIAREYSAQVIIMIRHPAAYVNSIKRLNWDMSLTSFSTQEKFMATLPEDLASEIYIHVKNKPESSGYYLEDAALSWKVFHYVIHRYQQFHPEWLFIKHEDLCGDFINGFQRLYSWLDLPWSEEVENQIKQYCQSQNIIPTEKQIHVLKRDSLSIPQGWKQSLISDEINRIRKITGNIADLFYDQNSWN